MPAVRVSHFRLGLFSLLAAALAGCAGGPSHQPPNAAKLKSIPNAVPHSLPKSSHGNPDTYTVFGKTYHVLDSARGYNKVGLASWYGPGFDGERTSSGETYDMYGMTAASKVLPLPTYVRVTNLKNGRHVIVKVNDRGPFHPGRIIDLSYTAAYKLGMTRKGTTLVRVRAIDPGQWASRHDSQHPPPGPQKAADEHDQRPTAPAPRSVASVAPAGDASRPHAQPAVATATNATTTARYVQVGAFSAIGHARALLARLHSAGFQKAFIEPPKPRNGLYRVRVGPFVASRRVQATRAKLGLLGITATVVSP